MAAGYGPDQSMLVVMALLLSEVDPERSYMGTALHTSCLSGQFRMEWSWIICAEIANAFDQTILKR
jgi:hypothetical protein